MRDEKEEVERELFRKTKELESFQDGLEIMQEELEYTREQNS